MRFNNYFKTYRKFFKCSATFHCWKSFFVIIFSFFPFLFNNWYFYLSCLETDCSDFIIVFSSSWFGQICCPSYFDQVEMVRLQSVSQWLESNIFNFSFWLKIWWPSHFDQFKMVKTPLRNHCSQFWCLARKKLGYDFLLKKNSS